ncbi:MAG: hypothetical protein ABIS20_22690 [Thermoanaerobaculia bacterium]
MLGIESFAKKWNIVSWVPPTSGPIPRNGFKDLSTVSITILSTPPGGTSGCDIAWQNSEGEPCSMSLLLQDGSLKGSVSVQFGGLAVDCQVTITLEGQQIRGMLDPTPIDGSSGNTGTFVADANPGDDELAST